MSLWEEIWHDQKREQQEATLATLATLGTPTLGARPCPALGSTDLNIEITEMCWIVQNWGIDLNRFPPVFHDFELEIQFLARILYGISFKAWLSGSVGHQKRRVVDGFQAACRNLEFWSLLRRVRPPVYTIVYHCRGTYSHVKQHVKKHVLTPFRFENLKRRWLENDGVLGSNRRIKSDEGNILTPRIFTYDGGRVTITTITGFDFT